MRGRKKIRLLRATGGMVALDARVVGRRESGVLAELRRVPRPAWNILAEGDAQPWLGRHDHAAVFHLQPFAKRKRCLATTFRSCR